MTADDEKELSVNDVRMPSSATVHKAIRNYLVNELGVTLEFVKAEVSKVVNRGVFARPPGHSAIAAYGARRGTGIVNIGAKPIVSFTSPAEVVHSTPSCTTSGVPRRSRSCHRGDAACRPARTWTSIAALVTNGNTSTTDIPAAPKVSSVASISVDGGSL